MYAIILEEQIVPTNKFGLPGTRALTVPVNSGDLFCRDLVPLLRVCLDYMLLCETPNLSHYASQCMQCMVERYKLQPNAVPGYEHTIFRTLITCSKDHL